MGPLQSSAAQVPASVDAPRGTHGAGRERATPPAAGPSGFRRSRRLFVRGLGLVFAIAFVSLWVQVEALIGSDGIAPAGRELSAWSAYCETAGESRWARFPTLFWIDSSDVALHAVCAVGLVAALAMLAGLVPALASAVACLCYLSLTVVGGAFLSFQWDVLLIETGVLACAYAPWRLRMSAARDREPPRAARWLLWLLLFRLMFLSGAFKLASGDAAWADGSALAFHYETQPLPTPLAWYAHQLPEAVQRWSCMAMFGVELVVPFFVFGPRTLRHLAVVPLVLLQVLIALTGNYGFFNLLTVVLCLTLLDDGALFGSGGAAAPRPAGIVQRLAAGLLALAVVPLGLLHVVRAAGEWGESEGVARLGDPVLSAVRPLRAVNSYGLFRVMTTERAEGLVEGSADGSEWLAYEFRFKPQGPLPGPGWVAPHMPRLDWQMWFLPFPWFAGASWQQHSPWFRGLLQSLLEGSDDVGGLFAENPFPEVPPRFVRARVLRLSFTDAEVRAETGDVWTLRNYPEGEFVPPISLKGAPDRTNSRTGPR